VACLGSLTGHMAELIGAWFTFHALCLLREMLQNAPFVIGMKLP
jgi:hypothetical protein